MMLNGCAIPANLRLARGGGEGSQGGEGVGRLAPVPHEQVGGVGQHGAAPGIGKVGAELVDGGARAHLVLHGEANESKHGETAWPKQRDRKESVIN
eukprot:70616-Pyramimonas_sp.AAC.1